MINEDDVGRAIQWLIDNASKAAEARAQREHMDEYRRVLRAQLMRERADLPLAAQEREAMADERYVAHLDALKTAIEADERFRWLRAAAETKCSVWQSLMKAKI